MTTRIPRYGERVIRARSVLALMSDEYREEYGTPAYGESTRLNHLRCASGTGMEVGA